MMLPGDSDSDSDSDSDTGSDSDSGSGIDSGSDSGFAQWIRIKRVTTDTGTLLCPTPT